MAQFTVLIVDDSATVRDMIAYDLRQEGYFVATACDGAQAMDILNTEKFDFIISDVDMPEMDGFAFIRALSALAHSPGVILISGHDAKSLYSAKQLALAYSINLLATIQKPVNKEELISALKTISRKGSSEKGFAGVLSETEFMRGLMTDGLVPVFQPKINSKNNSFYDVEVFARWQSASGSLMGAQSVVSLAREKGYMDVLTYRMLELAVDQAGKWKKRGLHIPISVNLTADNLRKADFADVVCGLVEQNDITPDMVTLEIGEAEMLMDERHLLEVMSRLHVRGFRLALDDFGTGFGSLMRLKSIPFDQLNIDRTFLENASEDKTAYIILESVVEMARKLNIASSCCGVSSQEYLNLAKNIKIDYVQGFHLGRPMSATELELWLEEFEGSS